MKIPRVTEILKPFSGYDKIPPLILDKAAVRGTTVHAICAGIAKGAWIPDPMIADNLLGYVNSFRKWSEAQVDEFLIIEQRYHDEDLNYSGQLDFVVKGKDAQLYLVDLKTTSKPQKTHPVQMAAYEHLLHREGIDISSALLVYLNKDGDFPDIDILDNTTHEFRVFRAALECWHYFHGDKGAKRVA